MLAVGIGAVSIGQLTFSPVVGLEPDEGKKQRYDPHHDGNNRRPAREQEIGLAHNRRDRPLRIRFRRPALLGKIEPHLGVAMVLRSRLVGLQDEDDRHQQAQEAAGLKRGARLERQADHDAEDG